MRLTPLVNPLQSTRYFIVCVNPRVKPRLPTSGIPPELRCFSRTSLYLLQGQFYLGAPISRHLHISDMEPEEEAWVKQRIQERENGIVRVVSLERKDAVPVGSNYISDIYRLKMKVLTMSGAAEKRSAIYKTLPVSENKLQGVREQGFFPLEIKMYDHILSAMGRLLRDKDPSADTLWPEFLGAWGESEGLLLEDLSVKGYLMEDRRTGFDFNQCAFILKNLSRFHALAAVQIDKDWLEIKEFPTRHFFLRTPEKTIDILRRRTYYLAKAIEDYWPNEWHEYVEALYKLPDKLAPEINEMYNDKIYKFKTINHGDIWVNNILFKYDTVGSPIAVKFVDYQFVHYHSPCLDIQYLLNSSLKLEYASMESELLKVYHTSLEENLKLFEYNKAIPSLEDLREDHEKVKLFGCHIGLVIRPFMINPPAHELEKIYSFSSSEEKRCLTYRHDGKTYLSLMRHCLKRLRELGLL